MLADRTRLVLLSQCFVKQLRALRQREQQLPEGPPEPASPPRQHADTSAAGLWPASSLTPRAREEAARVLRTVSEAFQMGRQTLRLATSEALSGALSPASSIGPAEPAVSERQRVRTLQLVFTAVMEDVISTLSGCASTKRPHTLTLRCTSWNLLARASFKDVLNECACMQTAFNTLVPFPRTHAELQYKECAALCLIQQCRYIYSDPA
jgi:hypothetical protein